MPNESGESGWLSYSLLGLATLASGVGWFFSGQWIDANDPYGKAGLAFFRTVLTLLPAVAAFAVAAWRQKRAEKQTAEKVDDLRVLIEQYVRLQSVQNELDSGDRLGKVARSAVVQMGNSASELFKAIEGVQDRASKDLLLERYRNHANGLVTLLNALSEQLSEIGRRISEDITADERINIVERADRNTQSGLDYANKIIQTRGISDGLKQLNSFIERAQTLQYEISSAVSKLSDSEKRPKLEAVVDGQD